MAELFGQRSDTAQTQGVRQSTVFKCVTDQTSITRSPRSVLNFKFSSSHFYHHKVLWGWWPAQWALSSEHKNATNVQWQKISTPSYEEYDYMYQRFAVKNSGASCLWGIREWPSLLSLPKICSSLLDMTSDIPFSRPNSWWMNTNTRLVKPILWSVHVAVWLKCNLSPK